MMLLAAIMLSDVAEYIGYLVLIIFGIMLAKMLFTLVKALWQS